MAIITFGKSGTRPYGMLIVTEKRVLNPLNASMIQIDFILKRPTTVPSYTNRKATCFINGDTYNWSGNVGGVGDKILLSTEQLVIHDDSGKKNISFSASITFNFNWNGKYIGTINGNGNMALTSIPRYATINQSLVSRTETGMDINWTSNTVIDHLWASTDNGATWMDIYSPNRVNGSYSLLGMDPNTNYQIRTRVRRKDNQLISDSSTLNVSTYDWPHASSMPNVTIGDELTLGFYNPLSRNIHVNLLGEDDSIIGDDYTTGTTITGYNNATVQERFYNSIPNSSSGTYKVKVTYDGHILTRTGGTYSVNPSQCAPYIGTVSYADINQAVIAITQNNQIIVRTQSQVQYSATGLGGQKGASVSSCTVSVNENTYNLNLSGSTASGGNAPINSATDVTATFTVTDSRGIQTNKTANITIWDWEPPSAIISLQRENNFYTRTGILVNAKYSYIGGRNSVTITYKAKKTSDSQYTITDTLQNNVQSFFNADNNFDWDVVVKLVDIFGDPAGANTYNLGLSRGTPIIFFDRIKSSVGINCFPKENNSLEVNNYNLSRNTMTRFLNSFITNLTTNNYTIIQLNSEKIFGSKLSATNDGGIQIGTNISKALISGICTYENVNSNGNRKLKIIKNTDIQGNTISFSSQTLTQSQPGQIVIPPILTEVQQGDVIYILYYTIDSADKIGGDTEGCTTGITVDVVS